MYNSKYTGSEIDDLLGSVPKVVQETGESTDTVMSQNAVTKALSSINSGGVTFSGYIGFSSKSAMADMALSDLSSYSNAANVSLTSAGGFLWVFSKEKISLYSSGVVIPLDYMGARDGYECYRTDDIVETSTFSVTFGKEESSSVQSTYAITNALTNLTASGASSISAGGTAAVQLTAASGYSLPEVSAITVTGASVVSYAGGLLTIGSATGDVTITAAGVKIAVVTYAITNALTNLTASGPTTISAGGTASVQLTAASGYSLPEVSAITVTGASVVSYAGGLLTIGSATGDVTITAAGVKSDTVAEKVIKEAFTLAEAWQEVDDVDLDNYAIEWKVKGITGGRGVLSFGATLTGGSTTPETSLKSYYINGIYKLLLNTGTNSKKLEVNNLTAAADTEFVVSFSKNGLTINGNAATYTNTTETFSEFFTSLNTACAGKLTIGANDTTISTGAYFEYIKIVKI